MKPFARIVASAAVIVFVAVAAQAQKAFIDYDRSVDLNSYKTFAIAPDGPDTLAKISPLAHQHLIDGLKQRIAAAGKLSEVKADPDLWVTYHVKAEEEANISTTGYGMGPGWGGGYYWGGGGWASSTTTVNTYTVGTLVVDIWDAKTEKAVWRGVASAVVPDNPQKGIKKIDSALDKLTKKWQEMRSKEK